MNKTLKLKIIERFDSRIELAKFIKEDEAIVSKIIRGHRVLPEHEQVRLAVAL